MAGQATAAIAAQTSAKGAGPAEDKSRLRLWLRLLTCSNLIEQEIRRRLRESFDITLPQFDLMAQLRRGPEIELTMGALGERMMVSQGNVTGIVDRLERDGMVTRERRREDRRTQWIALTPAGRTRFDEIAEIHEGWIAELFDGLNDKREAALYGGLGALKDSVLARRRPDQGGET